MKNQILFPPSFGGLDRPNDLRAIVDFHLSFSGQTLSLLWISKLHADNGRFRIFLEMDVMGEQGKVSCDCADTEMASNWDSKIDIVRFEGVADAVSYVLEHCRDQLRMVYPNLKW